MIGSTTMCEKRILALLDMYGRDTVMASIHEMMRRTEIAVRDEIRKIPNGVYYGAAATGSRRSRPATATAPGS